MFRGHHDEAALCGRFRQSKSNLSLVGCLLAVRRIVDFDSDRPSTWNQLRRVIVTKIQRLAAWRIDGFHGHEGAASRLTFSRSCENVGIRSKSASALAVYNNVATVGRKVKRHCRPRD